MAKHIIPAQEWISCDCCGVKCDQNNRAKSAVLLINAAGIDMVGFPVGPDNDRWELCDSCLGKLRLAVKQLFARQGTPI